MVSLAMAVKTSTANATEQVEFRIATAATPAGDLLLSFPAKIGKEYKVMKSRDGTTWSPAPGGTYYGNGGTMAYTVVLPRTNGSTPPTPTTQQQTAFYVRRFTDHGGAIIAWSAPSGVYYEKYVATSLAGVPPTFVHSYSSAILFCGLVTDVEWDDAFSSIGSAPLPTVEQTRLDQFLASLASLTTNGGQALLGADATPATSGDARPVLYRVRESQIDSDGDGLTDDLEWQVGLSAFDADTDGDGLSDGIEYSNPFSNANDPQSRAGVNDGDTVWFVAEMKGGTRSAYGFPSFLTGDSTLYGSRTLQRRMAGRSSQQAGRTVTYTGGPASEPSAAVTYKSASSLPIPKQVGWSTQTIHWLDETESYAVFPEGVSLGFLDFSAWPVESATVRRHVQTDTDAFPFSTLLVEPRSATNWLPPDFHQVTVNDRYEEMVIQTEPRNPTYTDAQLTQLANSFQGVYRVEPAATAVYRALYPPDQTAPKTVQKAKFKFVTSPSHAGTTVWYLKTWTPDAYQPPAAGAAPSPPQTVNEAISLQIGVNGESSMVTLDPTTEHSGVNGVLTAQPLPGGLRPDWNRDGKIDVTDKNLAGPGNPWRWWTNDDNDLGVIGDSDIPMGDTAANRDAAPGSSGLNAVDGPSDLADLFPLQIDVKELLAVWPPNVAQYRLTQTDGAVRYCETDLTVSQANDYLKDLDTVESYQTATLQDVAPAVTGHLSAPFLNKILNETGKGVILVEAVKASVQPLRLEILVGGNKIAELILPLSLSGVEKMYRHFNLRPDLAGLPEQTSAPNLPDSVTTDTYHVFLHGYNVSGQDARGWHAEMFKRLYRGGYRGRFVGVTWAGDPTNVGNLLPADYHQGVVNAFAAAPSLALKCQTLAPASKLTLMAHSLGNMLICAAHEDHGLRSRKYAAIDAAVALEAVNPTAAKPDSMISYGFDDAVPPGEPVYPQTKWIDYKNYTGQVAGTFERYLFASEWYQNWPANDARASLTWRGRFVHLPARTNFINLYSSSEDVLREYDGNGIWTVPELGTYAWVRQEKFKGNRRQAVPGVAGAGSDTAGWGFNTTDPIYGATINGILVTKTPAQLWTWFISNPAVNQVRLRDEPFFVKNPAALFGANGPNYALTNRGELLAKAFPARSLPLGANPVVMTSLVTDVDMADKHISDTARWPLKPDDTTNEWHHNTFKEMALPHVIKLYDFLAAQMNN